MKKTALIIVALLAVIAASAGTTVATAYFAPDLLPQGEHGERGPQGPQGNAGVVGPRGLPGEDGKDASDDYASDDYASEDYASSEPSESSGEEHYFYGGKDLGTVSQHEQFCRSMRERLDGERTMYGDETSYDDQDELEREGCRGGGTIKHPE